jgi:hypothetical protein
MRVSCGLRNIRVWDEVQDATVSVALLYPTNASEQVERFGPYSLEVAVNAPVAGSESTRCGALRLATDERHEPCHTLAGQISVRKDSGVLFYIGRAFPGGFEVAA